MSVAVQIKTAEHLLVSTYEERGVAVPFTTPLLGYARLRTDYRDRLEVSLGRFSDSDGYYVVRLETVPRLTTLMAHDTVLIDELLAIGTADPFRVKEAALNAATSGLAGTEISEHASRQIERQQNIAAVNRAAVALAVLRTIPGSADPSGQVDLETTEGQNRTLEALSAAASSRDDRAEMLGRVEQIASATSALGVATSPVRGPLRELMERLTELREAWIAWAGERLSTAADDARFCAEMAEISIQQGRKALRAADAKIGDAIAQTFRPGAKVPELTPLVRRVAFVLDGWEPLAGLWLDGPAKSDSEAFAALTEIKSALPIPPREALDRTRRQQVAGFVEHSRGWVRLNTDWLTGDVDYDALTQLERRKKAS